jgi:hypothetical protein
MLVPFLYMNQLQPDEMPLVYLVRVACVEGERLVVDRVL